MIQFLFVLCVVLFIFPYTIYPGFLLLFKAFFSKSSDKNIDISTYQPKVTILVAAYNEEQVIADKIKNCLALNYPSNKIEILIASDGSSDKTEKIVNQFASDNGNVKLLAYKIREGKVNVLNKAIFHCSGEIIFFSDANAMYNSNAIVNAVRHFNNPQVGCVAGEKRIVQNSNDNNVSGREGLYWKVESLIKSMESDLDTVIGADGALYAIRRELYEELPKNTSVDDFLESMLIVIKGYKIAYEPEAFSLESSGESSGKEFNRKVRIAAGNFYNLKYLTSFLKFNLRSFMFISHKLLRWISPFVLIFLTLLLVVLSIHSKPYQCLLLILLFTYLIGLMGVLFEKISLFRPKHFNFIGYFYLTVLSQLIGFIKFMDGSQKAIWEKMR
jgi:Glycosyltransferases, probably involved in cell wall biogenesis